MKKVLRAWEQHCTDPRLPRTINRRLKAAGLAVTSVTGYPIINTVLNEEVYSDGLLRLIMDFARQQRLIDGDELEAWSAEQRALSEQGRYFFGTMRYFFLASR
jgi:arsenite methyltransferase